MFILLPDRLCKSSYNIYLSLPVKVFYLHILYTIKSILPGGYVGSLNILPVNIYLLNSVKAIIIGIAIAKVSYTSIREWEGITYIEKLLN